MIAEKRPGSDKIGNPARNCVQLSNTGINIAVRTEAAKVFRKMVLTQRAKLQTANERSEAAEYLAAALMNQTQELEAVLEEVESENIELYSLLEDAFSQIAMTRIDAARVVLTLPGIFFDTDRAHLKPEAQVALAKMSGILMVFHRATVNIGGYTDSTGDSDRNRRLAKQRADSVKMFLFEQGVAEGRLTAVGFGPENPVGDNSTEKGRAMNRRVEMVIAVNQN
jgi:outer membrane protein OmpA-like peptidoglycan-associated protein